MLRKRQFQDLFIYMNGIRIGTLQRKATGNLIFIYGGDWLNEETARPISLSMPLTEAPYKGAIVENYFDNLLPDSTLIRNRIQARFGTPSSQAFDLLSNIGADCIGQSKYCHNQKQSL